jgi:hypothetical protein
MSAEKSNVSRRDLVRIILIGGVVTSVVVPNRWTKPIVTAYAAPPHGAASAPPTTPV